MTHALGAYVSVFANEYTDGQALQALKLLKNYLPSAYAKGAKDPNAREQVHSAASLAGIAFANAFLGVCHSIAHKLGAEFHLPRGLANALMIANVIRYNVIRDHERVEKLIAEIKQLLLDSYYGRAYAESYERDRETEKPVLRLQQRISG